MSTSPFERIKSENIISGYVNGIQSAVKDIQRLLDLNTEDVSGHKLKAVADQSDADLHYRIFEASKRNWLDDPEPVIYRNGEQVQFNEYNVYAAYGTVVFKSKQRASDTITADFTRVIDDSAVLNQIQDRLNNETPPGGGNEGQVLAKQSSDDHDYKWTDMETADPERQLPSGGDQNQVLAKNSAADYDTKWVDKPKDGQDGDDGEGVPKGGTSGQILAKATNSDYDTEWVEKPEGGGTEPGKSIEYNWDGTELGIRQEGESQYEYTDLQGPQGEPGEQGDPGEGVPTGGSSGQILAKSSASDYDTEWVEKPEGGGGSTETPDGIFPYLQVSGSYISHQKRIRDTYDSNGDRDNGAHEPGFGILTKGETLDAFPLPISEKTSIKEAAIMLSSSTAYPVRVRIGVYSDDGGRPKDLIFQTSDVIIQPGEWGRESMSETLEPGLYWIARHDKSDSYWNGLLENSVVEIQDFDAETFLQDFAERPQYITTYGGYRATGVTWTDGGTMPQTYPSGGDLFSRGSYGTPWLVVD